MHTAICDDLGIEFPIFAFTHCRDVVVAVSKAGGFGVLGAVGFTPRAARDRAATGSTSTSATTPTASTSSSPTSTRAWTPNLSADELTKTLQDMVPQEHVDFARKILVRPRRAGRGQRRGRVPAARLDRGDGHPAGRGRAAAPEGDADRQRARHPAGGHDQAHPRRGPQGRRAVRLAVAGAQARRRRRRHHHRPGRRGRRALRRGRLDRAVAAGRQGGRARSRCSPRAASAAASRSPRRWRSARRARGPARSG